MTEAKWFGVKKKKKKIKEIVGVTSLAACSVHADWMAGVLGSHPQQVFVVLSVDAVLFVDTYFTVTSLVTVCASLCLSVHPSVFADIVCDYKRHAYPFEIFQEGGKVRMDTWDLSSCALHCLTFSADHHYTTVRCAVCCLLTWSFSSLNASLLSAVSEASAAYVMYCRTASLCLPAWACRNRVILLGCLLRLGLCVLWNGSDVWRRGGKRCELPSFNF